MVSVASLPLRLPYNGCDADILPVIYAGSKLLYIPG